MAAAWESAPIVEDEAPPTRGGGLKRSAWESAPAVTPTVESALPNVAAGGLTPPGRRGAAAVPTAQEAAGGGYAAPQPQAPRPEPTTREKVIGAVEAGIEMLAQITGGSAGIVTGGLAGIVRSVGDGTFGTAGGAAAAAESAAAGGQAGAQMVRQGLRMNPITGPAVAAVELGGGGLGPEMSPVGQENVEQIGGIINQLPAFQPAIGPAGGAAAALTQPGGLRRSVGMITDAVRRAPIEEPPAASVGARGVDMATQRRERAAGLPVPVKLTKGDAERTFEQQRFEKEAAKNPEVGAPLRARKADQREAILKNFDDFVDQTGAADTDLNAVGKAVTDPIYEKAAKAKQEIRAAYDKADEAGETAELVNYTPVRAYIEDQTPTTREKLAPILKMAEEQLAKNDPEGSGQISIKALNDVRAAIRANTEFGTPNSVQGAEIIKRIDAATENAGGDLYKAARKLHQTYAAEFKNQGVIRDLINLKKGTTDRKVALADVFQRSVLGAKLEEVRAVKRTLTSAGDAGVQAWNDLRGRTIEWIKEEATKSATRDERGNPVISADKLGKAVDKLDRDGRLDELFGKQGAQQLRDVSDIARDIWTSPPDAVNTSNTASVLIGAVDTLITYMASGGTVPLPAFTLLKKGLQNLKERKLKAKVRYALGPDEPINGSPTRAFTPEPPPQGGTPPPTPPSPKKPPPVERIPVGQAKELRDIPTLPVERIRGKIPVGQAIELPAETGRAPDIKPLPVGQAREMSLADAPRETKRERELLTLRDQVTDPEIRKDIDGEIAAERQRATDAARADEYRRIAATTGDAGLRARFTAKAEKLAPTTKSSEPPPKLDMPAALPSWREFVAERMGPYMKSEGGHAGAMKRISEEWKTAKQQQPEPIPVGEATELEVQDATLDMVKATAQAEADWRREHRLGDMDAERAKTTAQALQYDAAAVERAAQQFENSPRAFDREVQRVIDEGEARANQGEQGAGGGKGLGRPAEAAGDAAGTRPEPAGPDRAAAAGAQRAQPAGEGGPTARRLKEAEAEFQANTEPTGNPITDRLSQKLRDDYDAAVAEYAARPDAKGGLVLNTDTARELSADYLKDRTKSADVHEPSSAFIKRVYAQRLHAPTPEGKERVVFFSAGGTGAGKSTGIAKLGDDLGSPEIVYDTNMNKAPSAIQKIDQALEAGRDVRIMYVYADPVDAFYQAMSRAMNMAKREGSGRTVPIKEHINTHVGARKVIDQLQERYKDDLRVDFYGVNNSLGKGNAQQAAIADLPQVSENGLREILERTLNEAHQRGEITDAIRAGFLAEASPAVRDKGVERRVPAPVQRGSEEGSQPGASAQGLTPAAADLGATGAQTSVVTERGLRVPVQYRLADIGALITSHDDSLKENPAFDQRIQPRDRSRMGSEAQITRMQNALQPELLAESPKASDGAPIVGPDGIVESGDARTIALRRAYGTGKADRYRAFLEENAERFGLKPEDVRTMQRPVLVRQRTVEVDRADFARQANESPVSAMSDTEQARSDAQRLPDLEGLVTADDGQLNLGGSAEFIRQFMRYVVSPSEQNQLMTADGRLNQRGAARIRNAIFSLAYNDVDTVAMMTESTDANVRNVLAGMLRAAPEVAHLRDLMDAGARSGRDFAPDLVEAVRRFSDAREQGMKVEQALAQGSLIGGEARPEVAALMRALEADSRAPKRIAEMIRGLVQEIDSGGDPRQGSLMEPGARYDLQNREQEE